MLAIRTYCVYGVTLESEHPFAAPLQNSSGSARLSLQFRHHPLSPESISSDRLVHVSRTRTPSGKPQRYIYQHAEGYVFRYTDIAEFDIRDDRIVCHLADSATAERAELFFLGPVMAFWLEERGVPALHASAVEVTGGVIAFAADSGHGKSSLAATFVQSGHALLTDDILPLKIDPTRIMAHPGYPQMRLWPSQARRFLGTADGLERVDSRHEKRRVPIGNGGFGHFSGQSKPVRCIYILDRRAESDGGDVYITAMTPSKAMMEIIVNSFAAPTLEALSRQRKRLQLLQRIVESVPVRRVSYPSGIARIPEVQKRILDDMGRTR